MSERKLTLAELKEFIHAIPFNRHVGIRLARAHKDGITLECKLTPELMNSSDVLHGGVTATLADVAAGCALTHYLGRPRAATTVELKLNYLRPVVSGRLRARAYLLRVGSTLASVRVDLTDDHKQLVGAALVTYMLLK